MSNSLVSVIIPVYNGVNYVEQAIESVLAQSYQNIEIIIIDDGSIDKTAELVKTYEVRPNVRYIYKENSGQAATLNLGTTLANGEYLSFIDHDDLWDQNKLQLQVNAFIEDPELSVVFTHMKNFAENEAAEKFTFERTPIPGYAISTMLIRTSSFNMIGPFNIEIKKGYFMPWYDLLQINGVKKLLLPELLYHRRIHGQNMAICSENDDYKDYFSALREIRRQRGH